MIVEIRRAVPAGWRHGMNNKLGTVISLSGHQIVRSASLDFHRGTFPRSNKYSTVPPKPAVVRGPQENTTVGSGQPGASCSSIVDCGQTKNHQLMRWADRPITIEPCDRSRPSALIAQRVRTPTGNSHGEAQGSTAQSVQIESSRGQRFFPPAGNVQSCWSSVA
jgi:hypothetical protein